MKSQSSQINSLSQVKSLPKHLNSENSVKSSHLVTQVIQVSQVKSSHSLFVFYRLIFSEPAMKVTQVSLCLSP